KARNVLFAAGDRAKLIDFGSTVPIGSPMTSGGRTREHEPQRCGFARECAAEGARITPAMDVYALAVLIYALLSGRLPFCGSGHGLDAGTDAPREAQKLRSPLKGADSAPKPLRALAERVTATLRAGDANGVGTLMQFGNVLESVHSGY